MHKVQPPRTPENQGKAEPGAAVSELTDTAALQSLHGPLLAVLAALQAGQVQSCALLLPQGRAMTVARKRHLC